MPTRKPALLMAAGTVIFLASAAVTLWVAVHAIRAAEAAPVRVEPPQSLQPRQQQASQPGDSGDPLVTKARVLNERSTDATPKHPPPAAPEESATISDDPTIAPDASQSADKNVSFPSDI